MHPRVRERERARVCVRAHVCDRALGGCARACARLLLLDRVHDVGARLVIAAGAEQDLALVLLCVAALEEPVALLDLRHGVALLGRGHQDLVQNILDAGREPRGKAGEQHVKDDAARPDVGHEAVVALVGENLGRHVVGRAARRVQQRRVVVRAVERAQPKVGDLEHRLLVEQQVLGLKVAVAHALPVAVLDARHELAKVLARRWLVETARRHCAAKKGGRGRKRRRVRREARRTDVREVVGTDVRAVVGTD
eukprot:4321384-Pleurochrysis_carterae.AAC.2